MDVTSLLNSGAAAAAAAEQQKKAESTRSSPTRSRTPWDAGGYSLPINSAPFTPQLNTKTSPQIQQYGLQPLENQTPTSPKHKFSDSRSSLSSFTSSLQSATHSRYSSMSTVNSTHPVSNLSFDGLSPKLRSTPHALELATIESISEARHSTSLSPTGSLDALALVAERHPFSQPATRHPSDDVTTSSTERGSSLPLAECLSQGRPSSPSDAILIKRSAVPVLRVNTGDSDLRRAEITEVNDNFLSAPPDTFQHHSQQQDQHARSHQRSYSAPALWQIVGENELRQTQTNESRDGNNYFLHSMSQDRTSMKQNRNAESVNDKISSSYLPAQGEAGMKQQKVKDNNYYSHPSTQEEASLPLSSTSGREHILGYPVSHLVDFRPNSDAVSLSEKGIISESLYDTQTPHTNRTASEKGFAMASSVANNPTSTGFSALVGPRAEPTPPLSHHPDNPSPTEENLTYASPDTPPVTQSEAEVACMFVTPCNTGSQLRKAISHILGRNKLCTRQIPKEIWVHFCRKHYQRSRYRNPKEYSKLQCDLVQKQIRRIHEWSRSNAESGRPGVVVDWELTIRKREQKRLDELSSTSRKRSSTMFDLNGDDEDNEDDGVSIPMNQRSSHVLTAVPQWLLDCCRKGYTTREILDVFNRLHTEVLADRITHFPDIEILPNITADDAPKSPKGYARRTAISMGAHRRTQSLGTTGLQSTSSSPINRSSLSSARNGEHPQSLPQDKRRRSSNRIGDALEERNSIHGRPAQGAVDSGRRMPQLMHRPVFPGIKENHFEEHFNESHFTHSPSSYQAPLPAPIPQRSGGHSMAAQLENNDYSQVSRRSLHGRSRSDVGGFAHHQMEYMSSSSGLAMNTGYMDRGFQMQDRSQQPSHIYPTTQLSQPQYRDSSSRWSGPGINDAVEAHSHQRHQSTPMVNSTYATQPAAFGRQIQLPYHPQHHQQPKLPFATRRILETNEARDLYSARR